MAADLTIWSACLRTLTFCFRSCDTRTGTRSNKRVQGRTWKMLCSKSKVKSKSSRQPRPTAGPHVLSASVHAILLVIDAILQCQDMSLLLIDLGHPTFSSFQLSHSRRNRDRTNCSKSWQLIPNGRSIQGLRYLQSLSAPGTVTPRIGQASTSTSARQIRLISA